MVVFKELLIKCSISLIFIALILFHNACKKLEIENVSPEIETIEVKLAEKYPEGTFKDYFSSSNLIALETNESSLIENIDRIVIFSERIFLLDKRSDAIFIFDNTGNFHSKIKSIGNGPREYESLTDFVVDKQNEILYLYSDRPYKLLKYDFNGKFISESRLNDFYFYMGYNDETLYFLNKNRPKNKMILIEELKTNEQHFKMDMKEEDHFFLTMGSQRPNIVQSLETLIHFPYKNTIYKLDDIEVSPKYKVDFGENNPPNNFINTLDGYHNIFDIVEKNNYGFRISDFRENQNYVTFKFHGANLVIYSKQTRKSEVFKFFYNKSKGEYLFFENYFAHDGDDDNIISVLPADQFKKQFDIFDKSKHSNSFWDDTPEYLKEIYQRIDTYSNPLLLVYTFK